MMKILSGETLRRYLEEITDRSEQNSLERDALVREIIGAVHRGGDEALIAFGKQFGDRDPERLMIGKSELESLADKLDKTSRGVLERSAANIMEFAEAMMASLNPFELNKKGYRTGMRFRPVEHAGCYVPGGRFPLPSSALMTALTARAAGAKQISIACPDPQPETAYAALLADVDAFYAIGGAQAIAALAFGTKSIQPVDIIVGPGNAYVTEAKRQLQGSVGIDMLAGPSEVAILADETADPRDIATDLFAQAEHDPDALVWLLTTSKEIAQSTIEELAQAVEEIELPPYIRATLEAGAILLCDSIDQAVDSINRISPEHLHLACTDAATLLQRIEHFGAAFLGTDSTVPLGDYMAGPNHTLPTAGSARFSSGLSPLTFLRTQTWMEATGDISELAADTARFADMEGLKAHAAAAQRRVTK